MSKEVQWDGRNDMFTVMLDATAIAEEYARIKRSDEELASHTRPRRKRARHARGSAPR